MSDSDQPLLAVTVAALCLSSLEFAISVVQLWEKRGQLLVLSELGSGVLLSHSVVSAVLVILATLLLPYAGNEHAALILLVCFCAVGAIPQGLQLILWYEVYLPGPVWVVGVGAMVICFVIKLGLSIAASFLTTQKTVPYALLSIFLVEYFLLVLIYLIIYYRRWVLPGRLNLDLIWSITTCFIMTVATSTSLALYYYSIIDRTTCLLILVPASLTRTLKPIGSRSLKLMRLTLEKSGYKGNKMFALSTESDAAWST